MKKEEDGEEENRSLDGNPRNSCVKVISPMKKGEGVEHKIEITSDVTIIYSLICSFIPQTFTDALLIAGTIIGSENTHSWQKQYNSYLD